jgi:hypothetical protein
MNAQNTPYEVQYESSRMSLVELNERLFSRKQQLEDKGYHCPWLLEDIGQAQPLLLTSADLSDTFEYDGTPLGKAITFSMGKDYEGLNFDVMVKYVPSKKEARCWGSHKVREESKLYELLQSAMAEFNGVTGIDLHITNEFTGRIFEE